ncbi:MAG: phage portal protein [Clostridiales bacterium]|nr:phage portal protein [Clostridiales bacterium]MCM1576990.1 phage portal protein [Bacteroides sp.]
MEDIFATYETANDRIQHLREKAVDVPSWDVLLKDYEPTQHAVVSDRIKLRDREIKGGSLEESARIYIGLEKLLVSRMVDFTFALPVKRVYHNTDGNDAASDKRRRIAEAIERIYKYARIDSENIKRGRAYYAACEYCTIWYTVPQQNTLYGFPSKYKLKCRTYSPMDGAHLYPLFDEYGDMVAMSFEYKYKTSEDGLVTYFETYTDDRHVKWRQAGADWEEVEFDNGISVLPNMLGKIPAIYSYRPVPVYHGLTLLRSEIEYALSRNSNIIAYNAAPVLKLAGGIAGEEKKGDGYRIFRVENGGDVSYVSWNQGIESLKYQIDQMLKLFFMQAQMPDISADRMMSLGNIGFDARQTILMDAHLKIGEESGAWIEAFERETSVIKSFLKMMNSEFATEIDNVEVEHVVTPFIQNDEKAEISKWSTACGGKAVMSQLEAIKNLGISSNPHETFEQIQREDLQSQSARMSSIFGGGSAE